VCPSSNVALGFVPTFNAHPLPRLRDAALAVTVNTDIPVVIGTSTATEYTRVREAFGYDGAVLADLARAATHASFAPPATKKNLLAQIDAWLPPPTSRRSARD
jgi:adenosine deaminase